MVMQDSRGLVMKDKRATLVKILERFEERYGIQNSAIFDDDGLVVSIGFRKRYMDENILGAYCAKILDATNDMMENVFKIPHGVTREITLGINGEIPHRKTDLHFITHRISMEVLDPETLRNVMQSMMLVIMPLKVGFSCFIVENYHSFILTRMSLPRIKVEIEEILFGD